jgi:hypothetical protein
MEQRDLIKDQIEQFALALRKIISNFLGYKSEGETTQGIEISNEQISNELNIDVADILSSNESDLKEYFEGNDMTAEHLELLSTYLEEIGRTLIINGNAKSKVYLEKSIELLELADVLSKTISFERMNKKSNVENLLRNKHF